MSVAKVVASPKLAGAGALCAITLVACGVKHDLEPPAGAMSATATPKAFERDPSRPPHPLGEDGSTAPYTLSH